MIRTTDLQDLLRSRFGHDDFLPLQREIIESVMGGNDALVLMPTGGGKSLCYQLPALALDGLTLVVSPLIALMQDQVGALKAIGIEAAFINSTQPRHEVARVQAAALSGDLKLLYVAPERLAMPGFKDGLRRLRVKLIAIDGAHCISEWGHDFRPDYRNLRDLRDDYPMAPIMALTATATEKVRRDIVNQLGLGVREPFVSSFNRPNLTYEARPKRRAFDSVLELLERHRDQPAIIYRFSRQDTERLASKLSANGYSAAPYHAGLDGDVRRKTLDSFLDGRLKIVVATIAFGMGIDKPDIRLIVHYDLPKSVEGYFQETGRAGRDGRPSDCVLLYSSGDQWKHDFFIKAINDEAARGNARQMLTRMVEYGELRTCRRRFLLSYFGEELDDDNCQGCDVCLASEQPEREFDATDIAQKIISAVVRTGQRFGARHVAAVLRGSKSERVRSAGHDRLSVYGIARDFSDEAVADFIGKLVDKGLLGKNGTEYPTLSVTPAGRDFIARRERLCLERPPGRRSVNSGRSVDVREMDGDLYGRLKDLRLRIASELGKPAYIVFSDASLREMASEVPRTNEDFLRVHGVGPQKLERFGAAFLSEIASTPTVAGTTKPRA